MLDALITEIEQHLLARATAGVPLASSTLGRMAVNDGKLVERLKAGGQITVGKAMRVREWIAADRAAHGLSVDERHIPTLPEPADDGAGAKAGAVQ
ncbi:hypothetical protein [uncultured Brevundimonas sp.]|uniref:hypothetical protein n=1 Tax=uncultured Brevundimonas sp. TaxID=213418 RepID=UPI002631A41A|nr:hypothetical protein [uncultured Brevundimonas sp.]